MEENFKVSPKSVDSGRWNTRENYLWKSQTKANRGLSRSWPFHIILNRNIEPVNHVRHFCWWICVCCIVLLTLCIIIILGARHDHNKIDPCEVSKRGALRPQKP